MILNNTFCVYMHKIPNNKVYIGITSREPEKRWGKDGYGYRNNLLFKRAIDKYGWKNIEHTILFKNLSEQEAKNKEICLISLYKSNNSKYGYNISIGGDYTTLGYKFSEKQKENLRKAKFKPIYCVEENKIYNSVKELQDSGHKYYNNTLNGTRNTYQGKHFIRAANLEKLKSGELELKNCFKKRVICLETKKIYNSISEAARDTNTRGNSISECCSGKLKSSNKLHWLYYDEKFDISLCDSIIKAKKKINNSNIRKIKCIETNEIFESCIDATRKLNIYHISECCNKKRKTAGGLHFEYCKEGDEYAL